MSTSTHTSQEVKFSKCASVNVGIYIIVSSTMEHGYLSEITASTGQNRITMREFPSQSQILMNPPPGGCHAQH